MPFHNLMDEGIHDFCEMLVLLLGKEMFLLFLKGLFEILLTNGGIKSEIYDGTKPASTLHMNESLCCCLLCDRFNHLHSLYICLTVQILEVLSSFVSFEVFVSPV